MRKPIVAFVMVAAVVAAAQPAGAIDDEFRGRYRLFAREMPGYTCPFWSSRRRVEVRYVSQKVREIDPVHSTAGVKWRLTYVPGKRFPWQTDSGDFVLRYRPDTDSAVGLMHGTQTDCRWHVRLVPLG